MNVGHRLAAVLVWIVALGTAYSQADKANSGHAGTPASKEALVSWLRSHQMVIGFDSAGAVVKVEGRIGGDLFHEGPRPRLTHDLLAGLAMLPKLERLNLCEVTMKDEDLAGVRGFSVLKELRLEGTGISGTGLRAFSGSTALAKLDVADEPNIGKGLESISPESLRTPILGRSRRERRSHSDRCAFPKPSDAGYRKSTDDRQGLTIARTAAEPAEHPRDMVPSERK